MGGGQHHQSTVLKVLVDLVEARSWDECPEMRRDCHEWRVERTRAEAL
jgi:hypothetical protein